MKGLGMKTIFFVVLLVYSSFMVAMHMPERRPLVALYAPVHTDEVANCWRSMRQFFLHEIDLFVDAQMKQPYQVQAVGPMVFMVRRYEIFSRDKTL